MSPWQVLVILIFWGLPIVAGYHLGKYKGQTSAGVILTVILGLLGLAIVACLPRSHEAKVAAAAKRMALEQEARMQAGYPYQQYPPQGPYPQQPYPQQPPYPPQSPYPQQGSW
jgi:hypothetical protein